ncbi:MAG: 5-formyltetrahydrofolate cyclo-ligase [Proteobacteria bacterium]|nr:5-formyltetrahydrofolate cyclo-ligase [Pseudomonadota bacterium]
METPAQIKQRLREQFRHRRGVIPADLVDTTRWKVINHLRTLIAQVTPAVVAAYHPLPGEINLLPLVEELWRDGQTVALPRVTTRNRPLVFNVWPPHGALLPDELGIPAANGAEINPALIIIPCLGYARSGHRLGSGAGYYDRTLATLPTPAISVGVAYTELELPTAFLPEPHDLALNFIVTGKELIPCNSPEKSSI